MDPADFGDDVEEYAAAIDEELEVRDYYTENNLLHKTPHVKSGQKYSKRRTKEERMGFVSGVK